MQEDAKNNLLKEEEKILSKIKIIVDFVTLYQKTNQKKTNENENCEKNVNADESETLIPNPSIEVKKEPEDENHNEDDKNEKFQQTCDSPGSWKESCDNSQTNFYSPEHFSQESVGNSPRTYENFDSSSQMSKESVGNENATIDNYGSPPPSSKESVGNTLFELDEGEDQFTLQSIECSAESEGVDYESSIE